MPELRKDPIVGRWVIVATDRAKRPETPKSEPLAVGPGLPVCYVIVSGAFSGVDVRFGQERAARFGRWKRLETLDRGSVTLPVFARSLVSACPFF